MGIIETKVRDKLPPNIIGNDLYNMYTKNRERNQGEGVMLRKNNIKSKKCELFKSCAELISMVVEKNYMGKREVASCYVKSTMQQSNDTICSSVEILEKRRNCKEIH